MGIELHCPQCRKLIRAPDNAGGRRGNCPYCQGSVYIPIPPEEREEIGIAPLDAEEEQRAAELRRESIRYVAGVDRVDPDDLTDRASEVNSPELDIGADVESFLVAMRDAKLDDAEATVQRLRRVRTGARDRVLSLLGDDAATVIEGVPPPVLKRFLESLLNRLD